jgi:hypothetical protein
MVQGRAAGRSFLSQLESLGQDLDLLRDEVLKGLAEEIVSRSPVDSGTYVRNHTVEEGRSAGGQFTSAFQSNPASANPDADRQAGLGKMYGEIASLPDGATEVSFNNRVPHASKVEYSGWGATGPYMVYKGAASRFPAILEAAKNKVGLK